METIKVQIGKKYNYFGRRLAKPRLRPDLKWDSNDKIDQYKSIQKIFQLHFDLERAKHVSEFKAKRFEFNELEQQVKEKQLKLGDLKSVEYQKVKNLLKDKKEKICVQKTPDQIIEDCECKLFDKRKMLDLLQYEQKKLCELYAFKITCLAELQDRVKYIEPHQTAEEMKVKSLEFILANAEIQMQTYENFMKHCATIINNFTDESLRYENTLNKLECEVKEQNSILESINKLGMPAYKGALQNKKYLEQMEKRTLQESTERQTKISTYKRALLKNEQQIFMHLPTDDHFKTIAPTRYERETSSVLKLRLQYETAENDTKHLCDAAACANTTELCTTLKDIFTKLKSGEDKINVLENQLIEMDERIGNASRMKDSLSYSVTMEDIDVTTRKTKIEQQIQLDLNTRRLIATKSKTIEEELFKVQFALQHLVNLLQNVNGARQMIHKEYPNEMLGLPLHELHLASYPDSTTTPITLEEDIDQLFKAIQLKIKPLMSEYTQVTDTDQFSKNCEKRHEELVLLELADDSMQNF